MFNIRKIFTRLSFLIVMVLMNTAAFSQDPGDPPDGPPPAVPIDDYLHLIIIAAGLILALITIKKYQKQLVK